MRLPVQSFLKQKYFVFWFTNRNYSFLRGTQAFLHPPHSSTDKDTVVHGPITAAECLSMCHRKSFERPSFYLLYSTCPTPPQSSCMTMLLNHLISGCKQVVSHLVQVGSLVCVNEAHHLFENFRLHVVDLHTVLADQKRNEGWMRCFTITQRPSSLESWLDLTLKWLKYFSVVLPGERTFHCVCCCQFI